MMHIPEDGLRIRRFTPRWEGRVAGYAKNYLVANSWRVRSKLDVDDLMQDAYLLFRELNAAYTVFSSRQFMALWKRALENRLLNHAKRAATTSCDPLPESLSKEDRAILDVDWRLDTQSAPFEVKVLLHSVARRTRKIRALSRKQKLAKRETTNQYLCRVARLPQTTPLRLLFEIWLGVYPK